ncbi:DegV family protein with EDD domain [Sporomusaceae bacterium BoRhaA]|uniref:DegV family protein n=1 Tax=Pelorhabdus rhamnosifermentans TaxID=2772457 RepID=UPI001C064477|nr:DegV family protein [Pelorhabdus rhamnosifermentans]MBU2702520.1 DegV family protein with EDD domain [Pelorhabdus rhamnosifermentans]
MANIQIVLDSTAHALPKWLLGHPCVHIASLTVEVGGKEYEEDQLSTEELFALMNSSASHPKTSQPPPGTFLSIYESLLKDECDIIVITLAEALSGTVQSAILARELCSKPLRVHVVDSVTTAIGMIKLAEYVMAAAERGQSVTNILQGLSSAVSATHTYFLPGTLDFLYKGGRIGGAAALVGSILQIRPVLYLAQGKVTVLEKVRTRRRAIDKLVDQITKMPSFAYLGIVHIANEEEAEQLAKRLSALFPTVPVIISTAGSVLAAHLGPGLLGVIFQEKVL